MLCINWVYICYIYSVFWCVISALGWFVLQLGFWATADAWLSIKVSSLSLCFQSQAQSGNCCIYKIYIIYMYVVCPPIYVCMCTLPLASFSWPAFPSIFRVISCVFLFLRVCILGNYFFILFFLLNLLVSWWCTDDILISTRQSLLWTGVLFRAINNIRHLGNDSLMLMQLFE